MTLTNNSIYKTKNPLNFVSWLEMQDNISVDVNENLKKYQTYISEWSRYNKDSKINEKNIISSLYVDLIKEITVNFSSEEEKRFIVNFNYNDTANLDIIIPFFVQKIKSICLYYSFKRESLKEKYSSTQFKGTNLSISKFVKNIIISNIQSGFSQKILEGRTTLPSLSAVNLFLDVSVEELYDNTNYFDANTFTKNNLLLNTAENVESEIYLNFTEAIKTAINQYPFYVDSLIGNLSVNINLSGTELSYLKERDFINYIISNNNEDLKLNLIKRLAPKYSSCDFYYLSTGSTASEVFTGTLFNISDYNSQPTQQLLNKNSSVYAEVQSLDSLYAAYELGKFFTPDKQGVVRYNSFNKFFTIDNSKLEKNSIYIFPDPQVVESDEDLNGIFPLTYKVDVTWNKIGRQDGFRFGDVISDRHYQLFYPYQSFSQELNTQPLGLSVATDNVNFWSDSEASVWKTDGNVWGNVKEIESLPIQSRTESLLFDIGVNTQWFVDLYGNQISLYKNLPENYTQYNKNIEIGGRVYVKETQTGLVSSFKHFFGSLYSKYPSRVIAELDSDIFSIYNIKNTLVIETSSFVLVDSYEYDLNEGIFKNTTLPGIFIPKFVINKNLEKYINSYYVEEEKNLYLCFLKLLPSLSGSNYKSIYPVVYKVNIDDNKVNQIYPTANFDTTVYSLSSSSYRNYPEVDLRRIEGGKFSYKKKFAAFNLTYYAYNLNDVPYLINEQFSIAAGRDKLYSYIPTLHKPYYYVRDTNFSNPEFDLSLRHGSSYSELIGYKDIETFNYTLDKTSKDKFHYSSPIGPVFINTAGRHFVQFDWNSYIFGNVYFGCESVGVAKLDEFNLVDFRDGAPALVLSEEETVYKVKDYLFNNKVYTVSAYRPFNSNGSIVTFVVEPSGFTYNNEIFCNDLIGTFKKVTVELRGNGIGRVTGTPACVDCGNVCEFYFPKFSSITLIPSGAPDNIFSGWVGSPCEGLASSCIATITDTTRLTAIFNKTPEYNVVVTSNLPGVVPIITNFTPISCGDNNCTYRIKENQVASLSADVLRGYIIDRFLGSDCLGAYDCSIPITDNLSLTAVYLSGAYSFKLYNVGVDNNTRKVGTVFYSLSAENPITDFLEDIIPVNTNITISATPDSDYRFVKFAGSPCESSGLSFCNFNVTRNYSISAIFNYPLFTVSTILSGNGLYYIESSTSRENNQKIDIGTKSLINTRNRSSAQFLSGERVTLTAFGVRLSPTFFSEINYLSAFGAETRIIDQNTAEITIPSITSNISVTALSIVDEFNFNVEKVGTNTAKFQVVTVQINDGPVTSLGFGISSLRYTATPGDIVKITPQLPVPGYNDVFKYITGSNNLVYQYEVDSSFILVDSVVGTTNIMTENFDSSLTTSDSIGSPITPFTESQYSIPIYIEPGSVNVIDINHYKNNTPSSTVTYSPLVDDEVIQVVYGVPNPILTEESIPSVNEIEILTQGDFSNTPLIQ